MVDKRNHSGHIKSIMQIKKPKKNIERRQTKGEEYDPRLAKNGNNNYVGYVQNSKKIVQDSCCYMNTKYIQIKKRQKLLKSYFSSFFLEKIICFLIQSCKRNEETGLKLQIHRKLVTKKLVYSICLVLKMPTINTSIKIHSSQGVKIRSLQHSQEMELFTQVQNQVFRANGVRAIPISRVRMFPMADATGEKVCLNQHSLFKGSQNIM